MSSLPYKKQTQRSQAPAALPGLQGERSLIHRVLSKPENFPDEFTSWLPRFLAQNANFQITNLQLPTVESIKIVGNTGNAAFENSWVAYGGGFVTPHYYKDPFGRVHLSGLLKNGTMNTPMFTLPPGYRPKEEEIFAIVSNDLFGEVRVAASGTVKPTVGSNLWVSLAGINFRQYS